MCGELWWQVILVVVMDFMVWFDGLLVVCDMCLGDVLVEMVCYCYGWLVCEDVVVFLKVLGVFQLCDGDVVLELLV